MATAIAPELEQKGRAARAAAPALARTPTTVKDRALLNVAEALEAQADRIIDANARDLEAGVASGLSSALMDRLLLDAMRIAGVAEGVRTIAALPDPVGQEIESYTRPDGLVIARRRVPLGVVGVIFESRPNVTVDIAALCFKAGDPCILRGGKEAVHTNTVLAAIIRDAIEAAGGPSEAVQFVEDTDRALVLQMLGMREFIDLIVPRGSSSLVNFVAEHAEMPAITGGIGVCHTYVDASAEVETAVAVTTNAKVRRPSVCNALDTVLVHAHAAPHVLPMLAGTMGEAGVELRCDRRSASLLASQPGASVIAATEDDFGQEFLDLILSRSRWWTPWTRRWSTSRATAPATRRPSSRRTATRRSASWTRLTPRRSSSTPAPASTTALSSALARSWPSAPTSSTLAAPWAFGS